LKLNANRQPANNRGVRNAISILQKVCNLLGQHSKSAPLPAS
jgi:hypothetical protein